MIERFKIYYTDPTEEDLSTKVFSPPKPSNVYGVPNPKLTLTVGLFLGVWVDLCFDFPVESRSRGTS